MDRHAAARAPWWRRERARELAGFTLVAAAALVAYLPSFSAAFQFDDYDQIVFNRVIRSPTLDQLLIWGRARIIPYAILALNAAIGGEDVFGYHVVNFGVHLLTCFLVFSLALALCRTPRMRATALAREPRLFATAAALIVACHPIQVQAVTYIVQRMSSMAAMFYVGSVLFYVSGRNRDTVALEPGRHARPAGGPRRAYAASVIFAIGAFLSKESSASLPLLIVLTEWIFFAGTAQARKLLRLAPFLLLVLAIPLAWKLSPTSKILVQGEHHEQPQDLVRILTLAADPSGNTTPLQYLLTQCTVVPRYLGLLVAPWGFNIDHDVPLAQGVSAAVGGGIVLLAVLLAFGCYAARRWPIVGFGVLWFFVALSVESSIFPIQDVMNEHRMYLAMPGVALALGAAFSRAADRRPAAVLTLGAAVVVVLCALTYARNQVWRTELSLWSDALAKAPGKARPYVNVGAALHQEGKLDEAIKYYCQALAIDPQNRPAQYNLNQLAAAQAEAGEGELEIEGKDEEGNLVFVPRDPCRRP